MLAALVLVAASQILADSASFAQIPSAAPPVEDEQILVTGSRDTARAVVDFVEAATIETDGQIAKFAAPVCPASFGLPAGHNEVIAARLRQIADYMDIGSRPEGCRPNVIVVVAEQGGDFVGRLRRERPELFAALELYQVRDVLRQSGPVRAWQTVEPRGADGRPMERISWLETGNGPPKYIPHGYRLDGVMPSLTQRPTRQDLTLAFIVFDLDALEGLTLLQIADHAAMRALARTGTAALPARRSILTLFADRDGGGAAADELTGWDVAYLSALYRTGNTVSARQQRSNIARAMRRELQASTEPPSDR